MTIAISPRQNILTQLYSSDGIDPMQRAYYSDSIEGFRNAHPDAVLGALIGATPFGAEPSQIAAWAEEIRILRKTLEPHSGSIYFEFSIPRMGRRIDVALLIGPVIFVLEFKVGEDSSPTYAIDQVTDYALDLKNFHETSHSPHIAPILIPSEAKMLDFQITTSLQRDLLLRPISVAPPQLGDAIEKVLSFAKGDAIV